MQTSIDGFVAGPNGELDWMTWDWDDALKDYVNNLTESVDTILLGRKMADGFISHWGNVIKDPDNPEYAAGKKFIDTPKVVFSKTLEKSGWDNTAVATGNLTDEVTRLKNLDGNDMIVYGGAGLVSSLIAANLIDRYYLFINPIVLGSGLAIFGDIEANQPLRLIKSQSFECGIVLLNYEK